MLRHLSEGIHFASETLKQEIEDAGCTGIEFQPVELSYHEWTAPEAKEKKYMENTFKIQMKKNITLLCLFIASITYSQSKIISPKNGKITFLKKEVITDNGKYKESLKTYIPELIQYSMKSVVIERELNGEFVDTTNLKALSGMLIDQNLVDFFMTELLNEEDDRQVKYHHIYKNASIYEFATSFDDPIKDYYKFIETKTGLEKNVSNDSITVIKPEEPYNYSFDEIIKLEEFRKEIREINGFTCFKVMLEYKSGLNENEGFDEDYASFVNSKKLTKELWVTEKIHSLYHPVLKYKSILEKYYPLEISEFTEAMIGFKTMYVIDDFDLK